MESEDEAKVAWKEKRELAHQSGESVRGTDSLHSSPPRETLLLLHNLPLPRRCQLPPLRSNVLTQCLRRTTPHIHVPQPLVLARRIPNETNEEATMPVLDRVRENLVSIVHVCAAASAVAGRGGVANWRAGKRMSSFGKWGASLEAWNRECMWKFDGATATVATTSRKGGSEEREREGLSGRERES